MLERVQGAILGTAIGDALGMPVESFKPSRIKELYGRLDRLEEPRDENPYHKLHKGQWTDDTQLMVAIAKSLIEQKCIDYDSIAVKHMEKLHDPRGWGKATTQSVVRMANKTKWWDSGEPNAAGNGPPMKIAPLGILFGLDFISKAELFTAGLNISRMTHKDPRAVAAGILQAWLIGRAMKGGPDGLREALKIANYECWHYEVSLGSNQNTLHTKLDDGDDSIFDVAQLPDNLIRNKYGTSAFVNQSVPFTYAMVVKYIKEPNEALINIVNQGGDADTTGAMAGALLGAAYGVHIFPKEFTEDLEDREKLMKLGEHLFQTFRGA